MNERGFSLIEVLAALLIFSLSIMGLIQAGTQSAQAVIIIEQKTLAGIVADNALVKARIMPLKIGAQNGEDTQMQRVFYYTLTTAKTESKDFYTLGIDVRQKGSEQIILSRRAFRGTK